MPFFCLSSPSISVLLLSLSSFCFSSRSVFLPSVVFLLIPLVLLPLSSSCLCPPFVSVLFLPLSSFCLSPPYALFSPPNESLLRLSFSSFFSSFCPTPPAFSLLLLRLSSFCPCPPPVPLLNSQYAFLPSLQRTFLSGSSSPRLLLLAFPSPLAFRAPSPRTSFQPALRQSVCATASPPLCPGLPCLRTAVFPPIPYSLYPPPLSSPAPVLSPPPRLFPNPIPSPATLYSVPSSCQVLLLPPSPLSLFFLSPPSVFRRPHLTPSQRPPVQRTPALPQSAGPHPRPLCFGLLHPEPSGRLLEKYISKHTCQIFIFSLIIPMALGGGGGVSRAERLGLLAMQRIESPGTVLPHPALTPFRPRSPLPRRTRPDAVARPAGGAPSRRPAAAAGRGPGGYLRRAHRREPAAAAAFCPDRQ